MTDILLAAHAAVMRPVQGADDAVQLDFHACTVAGFDNGAEVAQEGLDFAPVDVGAKGLIEDGLEQAFVIVTHRGTVPGNASTPDPRERRFCDSPILADGIHRGSTTARACGGAPRIFY